jgi:hypothetical protein
MRSFMQRSIQLVNEHAAEAGAFRVTRHGYLYVSCKEGAAARLLGEATSCHGVDGVRAVGSLTGSHARRRPPPHPSDDVVRGADVYTDAASALAAFPYLTPSVRGAMHARNAGWVSAQTMGMDMLDSVLARKRGVAPLTTVVRPRQG